MSIKNESFIRPKPKYNSSKSCLEELQSTGHFVVAFISNLKNWNKKKAMGKIILIFLYKWRENSSACCLLKFLASNKKGNVLFMWMQTSALSIFFLNIQDNILRQANFLCHRKHKWHPEILRKSLLIGKSSLTKMYLLKFSRLGGLLVAFRPEKQNWMESE